MAHLHPCNGGCWFCHKDDEDEHLYFDSEFDTWVHKNCISDALDKDDPEAEIMKYILGE